VLITLYALAMIAGGALAAREARAWIAAQGADEAHSAVASPMPGDPFSRDVIVTTSDAYHFVRVSWLSSDPVRATRPPLPRPELDDPIVRAALEAPAVRGFRGWMRLPFATVEATEGGHRVTLRD